MRLFAGGATTPLVVKIGTKQPWVKIRTNLIAISCYLEAKFDYGYFIIIFALWLKDFTQVILTKNEGVTLIFTIKNEIKIRKNRRHAFIFG